MARRLAVGLSGAGETAPAEQIETGAPAPRLTPGINPGRFTLRPCQPLPEEAGAQMV